MKLKILVILVISSFQTSNTARDYEYDYIDTEDSEQTKLNKFFYDDDHYDLEDNDDTHEPNEYYYDDTLPVDKLANVDTITIEQFVNELKRRKEAKKHQKQKGLTKGKSSSVKDTKTSEKKENTNIKKVKPQKEKRPRKQNSPSRPRQVKSQDQKQKQKRRPSKSGGIRQAGKSKATSPRKTKKKPERIPSLKNKIEAKPSRKQKPFHKPKKDTRHKIRDEEDEDPFLFGNSDSHQHSDQHTHQHDHLEAHKHHHKHKASHSHSHDHSNDHEHNHKHTHNHEHNHIHKHNEAHEHSAEHTHTEKHHHKHLEYIDAGGWRKRNDDYSQTMLEEEPSALYLESRGLKESNPKDNVKSYLKKFVEFYKFAASPEEDVKEMETYNIQEENEAAVNLEKPGSFDQLTHEKENAGEIAFKHLDFDKEKSSVINQPEYNPYNQQEERVQDFHDLYYDELALRNTGDDYDEDYRDYNTGEGVRFANKYSDEDYSDYNDQADYGSTNNAVWLAANGVNGSDDWLAANNEIIPVEKMSLERNDANQSKITLARSNEGYMNNQNSGKEGQTGNEESKTTDSNEKENEMEGRSLLQDIFYADYDGNTMMYNTAI